MLVWLREGAALLKRDRLDPNVRGLMAAVSAYPDVVRNEEDRRGWFKTEDREVRLRPAEIDRLYTFLSVLLVLPPDLRRVVMAMASGISLREMQRNDPKRRSHETQRALVERGIGLLLQWFYEQDTRCGDPDLTDLG